MFNISFGCCRHSVSNTFVQLTEGRSARDQPKQPPAKKNRNVEGEEEDEEQDEDYEDEGEPEGDDVEHPEPEGEDPSGSVNQINQMTMCVRGKPVTVAASSSSTERVCSEQHRVDEINLAEKFQSIGVGDPKRWLVDSGATCHIISERWLSHYKVVYKYEVGIPVLKGAGDNVLPTRGMVDLECKIGKIKVIRRKVVICALDLNVLSSYSLHEQGWETRLGTLKVSGLYHKKVKFPLKISDRAWWLEVLVLKIPGKSSRRKGNGPQDMEIDHVGTVQSSLSSKACQTKDVVTEVDLEHKKPVETLEGKREISCIPHVSAAENVGHFKNMSGTPLERLRDSRGGQKPSSFPFGIIGFSKPAVLAPWKGQRLVLCVYLGMRYVTGGGVLVFLVNPLGNRKVIRRHSFRIREGVQFDVQTVWPLLAGVIPNDPSVARPFVDPRESLENPVPEGVLEDDIPVFPSPGPIDPYPAAEPSAPSAAAPPSVAAPADDRMDVDLRGDDDDFPMEELGCIEDHCIHWYHQSVWNEFASIESCMEVGSTNTTFTEKFGGIDINVEVPSEVNDELTGLALDHSQVVEGMKTEVRQLESLKVGKNMTESEARKLAKEKGVKILTSRWVNTQKTPTLARCRLVVRDFASGAESAFRSGIYAPTSSLDSLRCVLALASLWDLWLITSDVSTAFMYAEVEEDACDLVLLPSNISFKGERVVCLLFKAMNGLRRAPLLWFYQLQRTIYTLGGEDTFESTLFRIPTKRGVILLLVYVDDLLIASQDQQEGENLLKKLMEIWKMKITGRIGCKKKGALQFLGRSIYRSQDGESSLYFGVSREYMVGIFESWGENIKAGHTGLMPKLEDVHKEFVKKFGEEPLTEKGIQRYRRVLGQLAWAALSRADLSFPISFLSRFQAKPNPAAEQCMRVFMKSLSGNLHFGQRMPAPQCPHAGESKEIVSFCDASWGLDSVSGAIFVYRGCCIKFFSRKQEVPALSSAEAEIISIVDTAKEMVSLGMLLQTMIQGIPLDPLGMPLQTTGEMGLTMFNDAKAAISMGKMDGLLRRVRHLELRVKYCQHLYRRRQLSLTHWRGDENPADGLTKSLRPLNLWTNLVDAVGLVPGPNEKGQNWIKNFLNQIQKEEELKELAQLNVDPNVRSKKGSCQ